MNMVEFENTSALDIELAEKVAALLAADIQARGKASLVVSGGRTPMGFFHLLSQQLLDWSSVTVTLADERWVDADHQDSNEKLVRENLLINEAHQAQFISLKSAAKNAVDAESECEQALASAGQFTVVILGMGDDGHTASLFPGTEALALGSGYEFRSHSDCSNAYSGSSPANEHDIAKAVKCRAGDYSYQWIQQAGRAARCTKWRQCRRAAHQSYFGSTGCAALSLLGEISQCRNVKALGYVP